MLGFCIFPQSFQRGLFARFPLGVALVSPLAFFACLVGGLGSDSSWIYAAHGRGSPGAGPPGPRCNALAIPLLTLLVFDLCSHFLCCNEIHLHLECYSSHLECFSSPKL